jgi:hypothetical protein
MPDDRLLHPRQGRSVKVSRLSDFEYRVWVQYLLSADDFGVLPASPSIFRGANLALAKHPERDVETAISTIVESDLVLGFEHQGESFVCDPHWQDFQKIRYPRRSIYPVPSVDAVRRFSGETAALFLKHRRDFSEELRKCFEIAKTMKRAVHRLTANGKRLTANGKRLTANGSRSEGGSGGKSTRVKLADVEFVAALKANPAYAGIDIDREFGKMDAWLSTPRGRGKQKTRGFVVNWLNRVDRPLSGSPRGRQYGKTADNDTNLDEMVTRLASMPKKEQP